MNYVHKYLVKILVQTFSRILFAFLKIDFLCNMRTKWDKKVEIPFDIMHINLMINAYAG